MIEDYIYMTDRSDISTLEYGYALKSGNTTAWIECEFDDDLTLSCPD